MIVLDASHHGELLDFLNEHSPAHSTGPGSSDVILWARHPRPRTGSWWPVAR